MFAPDAVRLVVEGLAEDLKFVNNERIALFICPLAALREVPAVGSI